MWDRIYDEGPSLLENLLAVPLPVISAVNDPTYIYAEIAVLGDIVVVTDHTEFADLAHVLGCSVLGNDVQIVYHLRSRLRDVVGHRSRHGSVGDDLISVSNSRM